MNILQAVEEMKASNIFSKEETMDWEDKDDKDKTLVHLQNYFGRLWERMKPYNCYGSKPHSYNSAAVATKLKEAQKPQQMNEMSALQPTYKRLL